MIPDDFVDWLRRKTDLVALIRDVTGISCSTEWWNPCPFCRDGSDAVLAVKPEKEMYYCHACHEAGDVFTLLMKYVGLDFEGAVREIAGRHGVAIPREGGFGLASTPWHCREDGLPDRIALAVRRTGVLPGSEGHLTLVREIRQALFRAARDGLDGP